MKQFILAFSILAVTSAGCKKNKNQQFELRATQAGWSNPDGLPLGSLPFIINTGETVTLSPDTCYVLTGRCFIDEGGVLEIPAGTRIESVKGVTSELSSVIIVTRGGKINARGTEDAPIVFTSHENCPAAGDWGGIMLLGRAPLNKGDDYSGPFTVPAGIDIIYGGGGACLGDAMDNSGILRYVRIEYAGAFVSPEEEESGLASYGVGAGTTLDHVEVAYANEDAFKFFGGTVNAKYLIALAPDDDAFAFTYGYTGNIQFAVSMLRNGISYSSNANGIECENNVTGASACKATRPVISNMTLIGLCDSTSAEMMSPVLLNAVLIRRTSEQVIRNSVFLGYPTGVLLQSSVSVASAVNFQYNTVQAFKTVSPGVTLDATNRLIRDNFTNTLAINLIEPCYACEPDFTPVRNLTDTSTLITDPVNFSGLPSFFTPTTYRGACNAGNVTDAKWPIHFWAKYDYPPYCMACD